MIIGLVGNQNSGKTTLFNLLTGANQKVGNWAGVTIEKKTGTIRGTNHQIVDLPGIYSLSPYSSEEEISRKFIMEEHPDIIINIVDATSIERSLYLTTQLLELDTKIIVALNMTDILEKKGITIDINSFARELGTEVIEISALKRTGIDELINSLNTCDINMIGNRVNYPEILELPIRKITKCLTKQKHQRFIAIKLLEEDSLFQNDMTEQIDQIIKEITTIDVEEQIAVARYDYIEKIKDSCFKFQPVDTSITDKLDRLLLNKWAALPIFAVIMFLVYFLSVGIVGSFTVDLIDAGISHFGEWLGEGLLARGASEWLISLLVDGIIAGVGAILNFIPQLIILFLLISLLETTGYMARIAFVLDRIFRKFGLSGKALIPFIVGSGCSVPGIMATRTIENEDERKMAVVLTPFIPCSAKLPIIALFGSAFFPKYAGLVSAGIYFLAIIIILVMAIILKKLFFKKTQDAFIFELPEYKAPSIRYVFRDVFDKTWAFIKRAGTIIFIASIVVWLLLSFSWKFEYGVDINDSILASIGNAFAWFLYPIIGTWSWEATVSAIQGLVAKEQVVSSMSIIAGFSADLAETELLFSTSAFSFFNSTSAISYMIFTIFSAPCFGAIGAMKNELGGTKKMLLAAGFQTLVAWLLAVLVFGIGSLIGFII